MINKKIWLNYPNTTRGPGMVAENLIKGLAKICIEKEIDVVNKPNIADYIGCLQHPQTLGMFMPTTALMGPNLFVIPAEDEPLVSKFQNYVVPSQWVKNLYQRFQVMKDKQIDVWPVGIDTEEWWIDPYNKPVSADFFVYCKGGRDKEAADIENSLTDMGLTSNGILKYGSYQEDDLKRLCFTSRFAALVTETESQGIAYMNILASGTPCMVFNKSVWNYENGSISCPATSVPYFDKRCGMFMNNYEDLIEFVDRRREFEPRKYILENHTLEISARKYVELLEKSHNQ